jgi:signal transduction histidine kinase
VHHQQDLDRTVTFDVPSLDLHARRMVLQLIFSNLIDNAVKYGGDPPQVRVSASRYGQNRVRVRIVSNGAGVAWEERRKIFKIFYRGGDELERRRKGTGLGLYIVHTLVRRMKGKVSVRDREDGRDGCVFEVELPGLVSSEASERPGASVETSAPRPEEVSA